VSKLRQVADEVIALETPEPFYAVGQWYLDFDHTSDQHMVDLLVESRRHWDRSLAEVVGNDQSDLVDLVDPVDRPLRDQDVAVCPSLGLTGYLTVPEDAKAMVVFVHGSGSSRHSPRNRFVARVLNQARLATLLFDLLTPQEEIERSNVFDIPLLGERLMEVTRWLHDEPDAGGLAVGYFGASTGSAAALWSAAKYGFDIGAVVSRSGRPDLAASCLPVVTAPTLLIVGERDDAVLELNRQSQSELTCENRLAIVPRATHLFEEPGTLQVAADLATNWFIAHLATGPGFSR
jgi:putative phosphoribosyl transferase